MLDYNYLRKIEKKNYFLGWSSRNAKRLKKNKPDVRPADEEYRFLVYGKGMTENECAQKIFPFSCLIFRNVRDSGHPLDTVTEYFFHLIHLILLISDLGISEEIHAMNPPPCLRPGRMQGGFIPVAV